MSEGLVVLSLFDGMACGLTALKRAGIPVKAYFAAEIDKYAIQIARKNHPEIISLGCVKQVRKMVELGVFGNVDLIIGGSPCQGFSFAGKQLAFDDPRSALFFDFIAILKAFPEAKFLLENVRMKKEHLDVITQLTGVEPHFINSSLVSAQNRQRYYWYNWEAEDPEDKGVTWKDVREYGVNGESYYYTEKALQWLDSHSQRKRKTLDIHSDSEKMQMIEVSHCKKYSSQRFFGVVDIPDDAQAVASIRGRRIDPQTLRRVDCNRKIPIEQHIEFRYDGKSNCLSTVGKDNVIVPFTLPNRIPTSSFFFRYITPIECERLQTLPDNYTEGVSNTQRYKMLGNGWTVDVIAHLLRSMHA